MSLSCHLPVVFPFLIESGPLGGRGQGIGCSAAAWRLHPDRHSRTNAERRGISPRVKGSGWRCQSVGGKCVQGRRPSQCERGERGEGSVAPLTPAAPRERSYQVGVAPVTPASGDISTVTGATRWRGGSPTVREGVILNGHALPHGRATAPIAIFRPFLGISRQSRHGANAARPQEIVARHREITSRLRENAARDREIDARDWEIAAQRREIDAREREISAQVYEIASREHANAARRTAKTARYTENASRQVASAAKLCANASLLTANGTNTRANQIHLRANASLCQKPEREGGHLSVHEFAPIASPLQYINAASSSHRRDVAPAWRKLSTP